MLASPCPALDRIVLKRDAGDISLAGRIYGDAADGRCLLQTPDGVLWPVEAKERPALLQDDEPFVAMRADDQARRMLDRLPAGFDVYRTKHYIVCYNSTKAYAMWCGGLYERLYTGFVNFWSRKGMRLSEPEFPLVAVVFGDEESYRKYAKAEGGEAVVGYYSLTTNRVTMFDLTGVAAARRPGDQRGSAGQINEMLTRDEAGANVATIIHEATHQLAFNTGMHQRYADIPLWLSEGMAMYFETPDLSSTRGWQTIGAVSTGRLRRFQEYIAAGRPADSLASLVTGNDRFRDPKQAAETYAESWTLNHLLLQRHQAKYVKYLKAMALKKPLAEDSAEKRLAEFQAAFGDLGRLDAELIRHAAKLK
jgi:hypothetical protein